MKYLLLFTIKFYWRFVPANKRRNCLYRKSCSRHVYDVTNTEGLIAGIMALNTRVKTCGPNCEVIYLDNENVVLIKLVNGELLQQDEISKDIVSDYLVNKIK